MIEILIALTSLFHVTYGHAAYYSEGVFKEVIQMRQSGNTAMSLPREVPPVIGFVATPYCSEIGSKVWIWHEGEFAGPYWVADCCVRDNGDCERMRKKSIVAEVDYWTANRWKKIGFGPKSINIAVVRFTPPVVPTPTPTVESPSFLPTTEFEEYEQNKNIQ